MSILTNDFQMFCIFSNSPKSQLQPKVQKFSLYIYVLSSGNNGFSLRGNGISAKDLAASGNQCSMVKKWIMIFLILMQLYIE